jgi:hypothetical protein
MSEPNNKTVAWLERDFPRADARDEFSAHTVENPLPEGARNAFLASKLRVLRTHPMSPSERRERVQDFLDRLQLEAPLTESLPGGGGVGYGVFYDPSFKVAFQTGTGLAWGIVFSTPPGGNVSTWLYLTGMNRAGMGAEAFIAYNGQNDISFNVFDWAVRQWQIHRPLATMGQYVGSITANGSQFPIVQLANLTYQNGPTSWVNEVQVLNQSTKTLDVAYRNQYSATLEQQTNSYIGSWAAELETFQTAYQGTNPMGCSNAMFAITDGNGAWSPWALLSSADALPRQDNNGFHTLFVDPAYSWAVSS